MTYEEAIKYLPTPMIVTNDETESMFNKEQIAYNMAIELFKKQIPMKPKHTLIKYGKHKWKRDENGNIDEFAWDFDYHNGVMCEVCGECYCVHCDPDYDKLEDCETEDWSCPVCNSIVYFNSFVCENCMQKLNWDEYKGK